MAAKKTPTPKKKAPKKKPRAADAPVSLGQRTRSGARGGRGRR